MIGSSKTGTELYVLAPRLPGEDCVISVVQGQDSLTYDEHFDYTVSTTVSTICGNGTPTYKDGALTEAQVSPYYLCVDDNENIFVISRNAPSGDAGTYTIARIDLENDELVSILAETGNVPCVAPDTQVVTCPTETNMGSFIEMNPLEMWAPRIRSFKWYDSNPPQHGWKHCMVVNPSDGKIYCRFYFGQLIKIDPKTYETELVCMTDQFDTYGMTFRPQEPNVLYFTGWQNHGLYKVDMNAENVEAVHVNGGNSTAGHRLVADILRRRRQHVRGRLLQPLHTSRHSRESGGNRARRPGRIGLGRRHAGGGQIQPTARHRHRARRFGVCGRLGQLPYPQALD